jgi:serine/threonine protein kinase
MRKELEIHWRLSEHPNIAKVFAYFYDKDYIYTVLEFAPEGNLYQKLRKAGKFDEIVVIHIIKQIISALWYC